MNRPALPSATLWSKAKVNCGINWGKTDIKPYWPMQCWRTERNAAIHCAHAASQQLGLNLGRARSTEGRRGAARGGTGWRSVLFPTRILRLFRAPAVAIILGLSLPDGPGVGNSAANRAFRCVIPLFVQNQIKMSEKGTSDVEDDKGWGTEATSYRFRSNHRSSRRILI